jgi:hypothetical protein
VPAVAGAIDTRDRTTRLFQPTRISLGPPGVERV